VLNKRRLLVLSLAVVPAIGLTVAFAQPGGRFSKGDRGGDPGGGFRTRGSGNFDPSQFADRIFDRYSNGQDVLDVNSWISQSMQRDPSAKAKIDLFLQQQNITNGRVTRDQFRAYFTQQRGSGGPPGGPPGGNNGQPDDAWYRSRFDRIDTNKDGFLQPMEIKAYIDSDPRNADRYGALMEEFDKWDKNKNGLIEFDEFKEFYAAQRAARQDQNGGPRGPQGYDEFQQQPQEEKQVVYRRLSDLPKDLPPWFTQVPHRNPGQIALYEWKSAGMKVADFRKYDRNADGFITVEEVLSVEHKHAPADRRGTPGSLEPEQPQEEKMVVLAGPGAVSDDVIVATLGSDGSFPAGFTRGPQMGNSNRGNRGGGPPNMGGPTRGGPRDPGNGRGGPPGNGRGNRPGRGGNGE
jgi:Ca2+-binding EF-hand superfamily protein